MYHHSTSSLLHHSTLTFSVRKTFLHRKTILYTRYLSYLYNKSPILRQSHLTPKLTYSSHSSPNLGKSKKLGLPDIHDLYTKKIPISVITAHDFPSASAADTAGVDIIFVGDSLAMVSMGYQDTSEVSLDEMIMHCRSVARGSRRALLVGDLPVGSYEISSEQAVASALCYIKQGRMDSVKLEGGEEMCETIKRIVKIGIPVCGHIGLTPQRINATGGFKVQGKSATSAMKILNDALAIQDAGVFAVVIEAVPAPVGEIITKRLSVPTIGIGAGNMCSGQVLVQNDLLGYTTTGQKVPKFVRQYENLWEKSVEAIRQYCDDVKTTKFPGKLHEYSMPVEELEAFKSLLNKNTP